MQLACDGVDALGQQHHVDLLPLQVDQSLALETNLREFADIKMIKELLKDDRMSDPMGYTDDDFF